MITAPSRRPTSMKCSGGHLPEDCRQSRRRPATDNNASSAIIAKVTINPRLFHGNRIANGGRWKWANWPILVALEAGFFPGRQARVVIKGGTRLSGRRWVLQCLDSPPRAPCMGGDVCRLRGSNRPQLAFTFL